MAFDAKSLANHLSRYLTPEKARVLAAAPDWVLQLALGQAALQSCPEEALLGLLTEEATRRFRVVLHQVRAALEIIAQEGGDS